MPKMRIIDDEAIERPFNYGQFTRLMGYLAPYKGRLIFALFLTMVSSGASLALIKLMTYAIDENITPGNLDGLGTIVLSMLALSAIGAVCMRYRVRITEFVGRTAIARLREDLFNHVQELQFSFFDTRSAGKIMVRIINDVNSLNDLLTNGIVDMLVNCFTLVLLVVLMLTENWKLTLISFSILPFLFLILFVMKRRMRRNWQSVRIKMSNMNGYLHESLSGMRVTESFVREDVNSDIFRDVNEDIRFSWMRAIRLNNFFWPSLDTMSTVGTILVYVFGIAMMDGAGGVSLGSLLTILWYLGRVWEPLNNLSNFYNNILVAAASMERIFEIFDTPVEIKSKPNALELPATSGLITFDDVTFGYDVEKTVLKNVSFEVRPGQTIALVGPTGAGKSTVVNLVSRFYDVTGGSLRIDGRDVRDAELHSLRAQMSVMMQDSFIFSGTIMDNIRYGRRDATDEQVIEAAKAVRAHDFIASMEKGYYTEVNERGSRLSTGQKQLISFARALLNDPRILILDEATSSIDTRTELLIQQALEVLLKGRTSFVIAHRLSTIRKSDCIMVIQDGNIAEAGTHEELIAMKGHYFELCQAQVRFLQEA